jgi:hypothetical protein
MADTPHFLDSFDVDPVEAHSNDPWRTGPEPRYARFDADDTAEREHAARDFAGPEARSDARWTRWVGWPARQARWGGKAYRDTAPSSAARSDLDAECAKFMADTAWLRADATQSEGRARLTPESAEVSAVRAELAAAAADLSAEIASSAAQSAAVERHLAFRLPTFVLGVIVGLMLAALIFVGVAIARGATPRAPGLTPHLDATPMYTSGSTPHLDQ